MAMSFIVDEILEMAGEIEQNGSRFYRQAAEKFSDVRIRRMCMDLAEMEDLHGRVFANMRTNLVGEGWATSLVDPEGEAIAYLRSYVSGVVFDRQADVTGLLAGKDQPEDILKLAIGLEKDSIVFYLGISEMLPKKSDKDKINTIIKEEMRHITFLGKELEKVI